MRSHQDKDVVFEKIDLTEEDKMIVDQSSHKPLKGYAVLVNERPMMYPEVKTTYDEITKLNIRVPLVKGEKLPVYELLAMPGCFYDGEWQNGRPHGSGKIYGRNGIYYQGAFV